MQANLSPKQLVQAAKLSPNKGISISTPNGVLLLFYRPITQIWVLLDKATATEFAIAYHTEDIESIIDTLLQPATDAERVASYASYVKQVEQDTAEYEAYKQEIDRERAEQEAREARAEEYLKAARKAGATGAPIQQNKLGLSGLYIYYYSGTNTVLTHSPYRIYAQGRKSVMITCLLEQILSPEEA